jgi:hypothetical protein
MAGVVEWLTMVGEFGIVFVIDYEVEEQRAAGFLATVQRPEQYDARAKVYDAFVAMNGTTLDDRADALRKHLWTNTELRRTCDEQWTYFNHLQFTVRRSLFHRRLVARWFPNVVISMWIMLRAYFKQRYELRRAPANRYFRDAVRYSLSQMKKIGFSLLPFTPQMAQRSR